MTLPKLAKKFRAFYGTRMIITSCTTHLTLSWARSIQSRTFQRFCLISILILSSHIRLSLPRGFLPSRFYTKTPKHTYPAYRTILHAPPITFSSILSSHLIIRDDHRSSISSLCSLIASACYYLVTFTLHLYPTEPHINLYNNFLLLHAQPIVKSYYATTTNNADHHYVNINASYIPSSSYAITRHYTKSSKWAT